MQRVEAVNAVYEAAPARIAAATVALLRVEEILKRPALGRDFGHAVAARAEHLPEGLNVGGSREAPRDPDDGDCIAVT